MADVIIGITIPDINNNIARLQAAINGLFPNWQTEHSTMNIKQFAEYLIKKNYLIPLVRKWEKLELEQAAQIEVNELTDLEIT